MRITLNVDEVAEMFGVSSDSIYKLVRENGVPHVRIGRRILFFKDSLEEWIKNPNRQAL